jgi:hypothetical protein
MNRTQNQVVTTTETVKTQPYKPTINTDISLAVIRQAIILGVVGIVIGIGLLTQPEAPPMLALAVPVALFAWPFVRLLLHDHGHQSRIARIQAMEEELMLRQQMIALKAIGDIDGDGKTDERDLVLQQQREESLLEYVRQVFLFKQSSARHSWAERGMGYDEWQRIQDVCIKAGLFTTHLDSAGKRHASKVQMSYPAAVHALKNSGALILTRLPDVIPQTGPSVKDSRNPVASERFDGPITTLPS